MHKEYVVANISPVEIEKINELQEELSKQSKKDIVLIAYTSKEPAE
jgi:hypothetical protein